MAASSIAGTFPVGRVAMKLDLSTLTLSSLVVVVAPQPFPGFNPKEEAERRGFSRPLPGSPHP
jgi:hypothetical protein